MSQQQKFDSTFKATLTGIRQALFPAQSDRTLTQNDRLEGKTCLITGANSGLGFAIAKQLADRGANLILAIRNGIPETAQILQQQTGNQNIEIEFVELFEYYNSIMLYEFNKINRNQNTNQFKIIYLTQTGPTLPSFDTCFKITLSF